MKKMGNSGFVGLNAIKKKLTWLAILVAIVGFIVVVIKNYEKKDIKTNKEEISAEKQDFQVSHDKDPVDNSISDSAVKIDNSKTQQNSELLKVQKSDFTVGDKNAPILFIEYASLSCPHCAAFIREAFDKLKTDFIDNGKVLYVYRDFPLNHPALAAAMIAQCRAAEGGSDFVVASEKFYSAVKILFRTQDSWAFDPKFIEKLETIFKLDGMSQESFKSCLADKKLQESILQRRMEVSKELALKSTPTFFVNGEAIDGYVDYKSIKELIEKKLANNK